MNLLLSGIGFFGYLLVFLWLFVALALILIILMQKGRGGGLSGAFGGMGGAGSLLGAKTGDFLTWITISLVALFLVVAVLMGKVVRPGLDKDLIAPTTPPAQATTGIEEATTTEPVEKTVETDTVDVEGTVENAVENVEQTVEETATDATNAVEETAAEAEQTTDAVEEALEGAVNDLTNTKK